MKIPAFINRFRREDKGSATVEFVVLFPLYMTLLVMAFESGIFMIRHVMLDRSVDLAVREIRLNPSEHTEYEDIRNLVCANMNIDAECQSSIMINMVPVDTTSWTGLTGEAQCRNSTLASAIDPYDPNSFQAGASNEFMMIQVCGVYEPVIPLTALGLGLQQRPGGTYGIIIKSGFVNEPS